MLPIYYCTINDSIDGLTAISLVESPAIESDFVYFNKQEEIKCSILDEEQRIVTGPVLIPEKLIYRRKADGFEYYVKFSADCIKQIAEKFFIDGNQGNVTIDHSTKVEGVNLLELFIKDSTKGINTIFDVPDGSLIATYRVNNDSVWKAIKDGTFKGFSIEGIVSYEEEEEKDWEEILDLVKKLKNVK